MASWIPVGLTLKLPAPLLSVSLFPDSIQEFGLGSSWGWGGFYDSWRGSKRLRLAMASDSTIDFCEYLGVRAGSVGLDGVWIWVGQGDAGLVKVWARSG